MGAGDVTSRGCPTCGREVEIHTEDCTLPQPNQPTVDLLHPEVRSTCDAIRHWWRNR